VHSKSFGLEKSSHLSPVILITTPIPNFRNLHTGDTPFPTLLPPVS
jgi:hypothetical protein